MKRSYTLDADVVAGAEELAEGSVSAFVNEATKREIWRRRGLAFLTELDEERGRASANAEAVAWAEAALAKMDRAAANRRSDANVEEAS